MGKTFITKCGNMPTITKTNKELIFFVSHLDDFEFSCLGFLIKRHQDYKKIKIVTATKLEAKQKIWKKNLKVICKFLNTEIEDYNLGFNQRTLNENYDKLKDSFYKIVDFNSHCDLVTHDQSDLHSDHQSVNRASRGLLKYVDGFITIYSPSSFEFNPNYYVEISEEEYELKRKLLQEYDFSKEESYSKKGTYFRREYTNISSVYALENFVDREIRYCEIYKIYKWLEK